MKHLIPQGNELIEEGDGHGHSTLFFISKKNPYPNPEELPSKIANGEVKAFVFKKVKYSVLLNHNIFHFAHTVPGQKGGDHLHSVHASSRGVLQVGDLRQQSPQDKRQDQPSTRGHLHARGLSIKVALNPSQTCFNKVRLKGYGEKGSQESSFQNRRGTQEMAPVHGEERRLSRFLFFPFFVPKPCSSPNSLACFDASRDLVTTLGSFSMCEEEDRQEISSDKEGILMDLADSRLYLKVLSVMKKADIESPINLCPILTT